MDWFWGADCLAMFSPTRLTWARTSVAKQSNCGSRLFERLRTWPNVTERDHAWRMWHCRYLLPQLTHEWLMLPWKGFEILWRNICNLCCTTMFPGLLPSSWLLEFSSSNVFNYSFIFFHIFSLLLSMMCSPSCRSLNFVPTCRPFSPVLFSVLYRMACSPVRLWALATICHYLPQFATICQFFVLTPRGV